MYAARSARSVLLAAVAAFTSLLAFAAPPGQLAMAAETCTISAKLVNSCRPWLGAASGGYGKSGFRTHIEYHEARAGRQVDIAHDYLQPGQLLTSDERYFAGRANTILLLNWKPVDSWAKGSGSNASANAYIDQMADQIKGLGTTRIMLNLNHEPENDVSSGGAPSCGTKRLSGRMGSAADYVTMWHNVRARFDARGVSNVVWVMNYMGWTNWYCMTRDLWPGNDYVDWVMWDPYPNVATWQSHVSGFYDYLLSVNDAQHDFASKPWGLAEYGYKGTSQTAAYQMYADVRLNLDRFSRLRAYSVWDNSGNLDVRVGYSSKGVLDQKEQDAYNTLVRDPVFQGTTVPADSQAPTVPTGLAGTGLAGTGGVSVELTWNAATDNTGVTGYTVQRDGGARRRRELQCLQRAGDRHRALPGAGRDRPQHPGGVHRHAGGRRDLGGPARLAREYGRPGGGLLHGAARRGAAGGAAGRHPAPHRRHGEGGHRVPLRRARHGHLRQRLRTECCGEGHGPGGQPG
jgi:plasmid stabilization system protein ParE